MESDRSIVIFGAGAVGGYLGARLAPLAGQSLCLVARPGLAGSIQARGIAVDEGGTRTVAHPVTTGDAINCPSADLLILTVRAYDVAAAIPQIGPILKPDGLVLAMQNGVGSEEVLAESIGRRRVITGTLTTSVELNPETMTVTSTGRGGVALSGMANDVPEWVGHLFRAAGIATRSIQDYRSLRWSKLLLNMLGAASSAVLDMDVKPMFADSRIFRLEQLAFREAMRVISAERITTVPLPGYPVPLVRALMRLPRLPAQRLLAPRIASSRSGRSPASRKDMARGKSEVPFLNGAIARHAEPVGVRAPVNQALTDLVELLIGDPGLREQYRARPGEMVGYLQDRGIKV